MGMSTIAKCRLKNDTDFSRVFCNIRNAIHHLIQKSLKENNKVPYSICQRKNYNIFNPDYETQFYPGYINAMLRFPLFIPENEFNPQGAYQDFFTTNLGERVNITNEARSLHVFYDVDTREISVNIGNWGRGVEIVNSVMSSFADEYLIQENDCDDDTAFIMKRTEESVYEKTKKI